MIMKGVEVSRRIDAIRIQHDLTQDKFARVLSVSQPAVSQYLNGRVPPAEVLLDIARLGNVSMEWLLTGRDKDAYGRKVAESASRYGSATGISTKWLRLPPDVRHALEQLIDGYLEGDK
ncbi:MAG: helix-turn-helix domain-containing protein [Caldithrix sp.]|nr:helix-turn-helix domain-containing protein [Caldithrix sp.]